MNITSISPTDAQNPGESLSLPVSTGAPVESFIFKFNGSIKCLVNGKLYILDKNEKRWIEWVTCISKKNIRLVKSKFDVLFAITESGELFGRGRTNFGQCGVVSDEFLEDFVRIDVARKSRGPCPHGLKFDEEGDIIVVDVACTKTSVNVVDSEGRVWTYGNGNVVIDSDGKVQVTQVKFAAKALKVFCGKSHSIALCEPNPALDQSRLTYDESSQSLLHPDSSFLTDSPSASRRRNSVNNKCEQCVADTNCRLSLFMKLADESASYAQSTTENETSSSKPAAPPPTVSETPKRSTPTQLRMKLRLDKLRFNFRGSRSSSKKEMPKTVWHTNSLPLGSSLGSFGTPKTPRKEEDGVEMSTIATLPRPSTHYPPAVTDLTASSHFGYVNLDNFIGMDESSLSATPESNSKRPSVSTNSIPSVEQSPLNGPKTPANCSSIYQLSVELWSWGNNRCGQLGHADTITRKEPKKIRGITGPIIKVSVGNDHNVVVCATGESYVWGSNSNGQLKQVNQTYVDSPILWRLGAESTILDAEAEDEFMSAIVFGQSRKLNAQPLIYLFGKAEGMADSSTMVLSGVEKSGNPVKIALMEENIWIGILDSELMDKAKTYSKLQAVSKVARFAGLLNSLTQKLISSSTDPDVTVLLRKLGEKVRFWEEAQASLSSCLFRAFLAFADATLVHEVAKCCGFRTLCRAILELHFAYVEAIGYRCFSDISMDSDLSSRVDKLCLDYNTESTVQQRKLRYLYRLPFDFFQGLRPVLDVTMTEALPPGFWKQFDRTLERNEDYAKQTYAARAQLIQFGIDTEIAKPGRLVIWTSYESAESTSQVKVKDTSAVASLSTYATTTPWRRFIGVSFNSVVIFSDAFSLIQNGTQVLLDFPLVWMNSFSGKGLDTAEHENTPQLSETEKELTVQILAPEYEFHVEFPAVEMKNDMLNAFAASFRLHRERTELTVFDDTVGNSVHVLPLARYGSYEYTANHPLYKHCRYEGYWKNGLPHGHGVLIYPDGKEYRGRFDRGTIHGFGEMKVPDPHKSPSPLMSSVFFTESYVTKVDRYNVYKGRFKDGKLSGLAQIMYANGDTYEGYCINGLSDGHGVFKSDVGGQQVYVGGWSKGVRNGYGVMSLNKERYLGMWKDGLRHDKGCQITIDGVFHEGIFDRDRFVKGRAVYQQNESDPPASFEGEFERIGVVAGKGILRLTPKDQIEGVIHGQFLTGELKISHATYSRRDPGIHVNPSMAALHTVEEGPELSPWAVSADVKWKEIFDHFLQFELGFPASGAISVQQVQKAWDRLSASVEKIKSVKKVQIDDRLERVPDVHAEWSASYYAMVTEYWHLCLSTPHHPINRLVNGLVEIFCCSYNNIGTHPTMYDSAVLEFLSLITRTYSLFRHIFPQLPAANHMYQSIPDDSISTVEEGQKDFVIASSSSSAESSETGSIRSTEEEMRIRSKNSSTGTGGEDFTVATPCCDFVIHYLFGQCYAELFTMYSIKCSDMDKKYWERVVLLNTATDAKLLICLGVEKSLWPTETENTADLDKFMVRVTARKKFYETAIHTLQRLSCEFNPSSKLSILAETFSEISTCVSQFSSVGNSHVWSGDDLLPAFMYVVVRAQLQHLGAEIRLIHDFCPQVSGSGQIDLMFTMLCASYVHVCNEKSVP